MKLTNQTITKRMFLFTRPRQASVFTFQRTVWNHLLKLHEPFIRSKNKSTDGVKLFEAIHLSSFTWIIVNDQAYVSQKFSLFACLTSQQNESVSQGQICSDKFTCCHTQIEVADQTFHLTQSQYTDTRPTSPSTDPITPGAWQGSHWSANF